MILVLDYWLICMMKYLLVGSHICWLYDEVCLLVNILNWAICCWLSCDELSWRWSYDVVDMVKYWLVWSKFMTKFENDDGLRNMLDDCWWCDQYILVIDDWVLGALKRWWNVIVTWLDPKTKNKWLLINHEIYLALINI